jgi:flagellum-specific peptidoglycan hydrolase FlgJ
LIQRIYTVSLEIEKKTGIPALFSTAQPVQEATWDIISLKVKGVESYNFYGIKWHYGDKFVQTTGSDAAKYQVYTSYEDCMRDHAELLTKNITSDRAVKLNPKDPMTYKKALERYKKDKNLKAYAENVAIVYAGDVHYAAKVLNIIETLKIKLGVKEVMTAYEQEVKDSRVLLLKLGIMNTVNQPVDDGRLAVVIARLIKAIQDKKI